MKHLSKLILTINGVAFVGAVAWLVSQPSWEPAVTSLILLATLLTLFFADRKSPHAMLGHGGAAIRTEDTANLHLENQGVVRAGAGGTGGSGGDAIHIANGVQVTIINKGVIAGGNAGHVGPSHDDKWVDFQYANDCGLQERLTNAGYQVAWCFDTKLSRKIDHEGWEIVTELNEKGIPMRFRLKDKPTDQTLIKKLGANG
jgi:hypothetical protein